jgi:hypothetical protein
MIRAAKSEPPPPRLQKFSRAAAGVAPVVFTVSTAVPLPPAARFMLAGLNPHVGTLSAPAGEAVMEHFRFIVPEYVLPAVRVMPPAAADPGDTEEKGAIAIANGATVTTVVVVATA